jgi:hypothetical protein
LIALTSYRLSFAEGEKKDERGSLMSFEGKVHRHRVKEKLANKAPIDFLEIPANAMQYPGIY